VNNWHWVEKNATPWSRDRLTSLFIGQLIEGNGVKLILTEFKKFEGEATANNRKAKLIFLFEWELEIKFTAKVDGSDIEYSGFIGIPNLSDENEADEVNLSTEIETKGPHEAQIRLLINVSGLEMIRNQCEVYIRELKEEFSKGLILPTDKPKPQVIGKGGNSGVDKRTFQNEVVTAATPKNTSPSASTSISDKMLTLNDSFKIPPERLYEILTTPELVQAWTNGPVVLDVKPGGEFSMMGGQIAGRFVKLVENKEIYMEWRLKKYPEGYFIKVKMTLKDQNDSTELIIEADGIPEAQYDDTTLGFTRYYLQQIGRTFGCGMKLF